MQIYCPQPKTRVSFLTIIVVLVSTASLFCSVFGVLWVESLPLSALILFLLLCVCLVCLVFLDCGGLPLYGRWIAHVDALWPLGLMGGSWNERRSFLCFYFSLPQFFFIFFCYDSLRMYLLKAMMRSINPREESLTSNTLFLGQCYSNSHQYGSIGRRDDVQDTFNTINLCMWWRAWLVVWKTWKRWWKDCMTSQIPANLSFCLWGGEEEECGNGLRKSSNMK